MTYCRSTNAQERVLHLSLAEKCNIYNVMAERAGDFVEMLIKFSLKIRLI